MLNVLFLGTSYWVAVIIMCSYVFDWLANSYTVHDVVICVERGANDLHMVLLMPLPHHHSSIH